MADLAIIVGLSPRRLRKSKPTPCLVDYVWGRPRYCAPDVLR